MKTCTFFGHRDAPETVVPKLRAVLTDLIGNHQVTMFYVGNQGHFDFYVRHTLQQLQKQYPHIQYAVVLAYMPGKQNVYEDHRDTMVPEGVENVHPQYAVSWRNDWMLKQADYVVTYIAHPWGGAARYAQKAVRAGKATVNLA